jgi:hypothetical protein
LTNEHYWLRQVLNITKRKKGLNDVERNLVTCPAVIFFASAETIRDFDFRLPELDDGVVFVHVLHGLFHSKKLDKRKSSGLSFTMVSFGSTNPPPSPSLPPTKQTRVESYVEG